MDQQMPQQGDVLRQYRLVEKLDRDALGDLWLAEHAVSHTRVVTRALWPDRIREGSPARLQTHLAISAPHLLPMIDAAVDIGWPHIVYEHTDATRLDVALGDEGSVPWASAAEVAAQILEGLRELHTYKLAYGQVLPTSVHVTEERVILADAGVQTAYAPDVLSQLSDAEAVFGHVLEPTPAGDVAGVAGLMWGMIAGQEPSGELEPLASFDPEAPPELDEFIASCRAHLGAGPYAGAGEALSVLRKIISEGLGVVTEEVDGVAAPAVDDDDLPPDEADAGTEDAQPEAAGAQPAHQTTDDQRVCELMARQAREGATPDLAAEIKRLQVGIGREQLAKAKGMRGKAKMTRLGPSAGFGWTLPGVIALFVFVILWLVIQTALRGTELDPSSRMAISVLAPGFLVGVGLWAAVALGATKRQARCLAVISDTEVACHDERTLTELLRVPAAGVRLVHVISAGNPSRDEPASIRITGWDESVTSLEFLDAHLFQDEEEEDEQ